MEIIFPNRGRGGGGRRIIAAPILAAAAAMLSAKTQPWRLYSPPLTSRTKKGVGAMRALQANAVMRIQSAFKNAGIRFLDNDAEAGLGFGSENRSRKAASSRSLV